MNFSLLLWILAAVLVSKGTVQGVRGLACNWGTQATHPLPADIVVKLLKDNGFNKVKLFEADPAALKALGKSNIQVMVGIPNELLATIATSASNAEAWVQQNISQYVSKHGTDIRYVAVGNEPFLHAYGDKFVQTTFPALQNIQAALTRAGLAQQIKATVPLNADVYETGSSLPSGGDFRPDILTLITNILKLLQQSGSPVIINIYPFLSLQSDPNFPKEYAFFNNSAAPLVDGSITYTNVYDANFDTLIAALEKNGFATIPVIIGEVGWPTDGDPNANVENARRFNQGLLTRIISGQGTPKRRTPPDVYLFSLIDEDNKTTEPGKFERHWGIFNFDGSMKYRLDLANGKSLVPAKGVKYLARRWCVMAAQANEADPNLGNALSYACQFADCTSLGLGSSCANLDVRRNASYAFNMYYQTEDQRPDACNFNGLAAVTTTDPSPTGCRFEIMIDSREQQSARSSAVHGTGNWAIGLVLGLALGLGLGSVICGI